MDVRPDPLARLRAAAYAYVGYLVLVVLWGAWVRISFSGDGCGDHWPLCHGTATPDLRDGRTAVEFLHRITSGLAGPLGLGLLVAVRRKLPAGHPARRHALVAFVLLVLEGLFGAALVKLRLVAHDTSVERGYVVALHLANTFGLLAASLAVAIRCVPVPRLGPSPLREPAVLAGAALMLLTGCTGAITALGDTLFPSQGFRAGLVADFDPSSHPFLQLRAFHPLFALATAAVMMHLAARRFGASSPEARRVATVLGIAVLVQVAVGLGSVFWFGVTAAMQLVHLGLADVVLLAFTAVALRYHED